jgi:multimeric flavodoxin WrbA
MDILIVYGGNGLANDLSLLAVEQINTVLNELEVNVTRFYLTYDNISEEFIEALEKADGVVLATTVEWIGIGGKMQAFLDSCYLSDNQQIFSDKYLMSVVLTKTTGDRDAASYLLKSWEMLGGIEAVTLSGRIESSVDLETNRNVISIIDKKTEDFYRIINQKRQVLPTGTIGTVNNNNMTLEQKNANNDMNIVNELINDNLLYNNQSVYQKEEPHIIKQKQDIQELTAFFNQKLTSDEKFSNNEYIHTLIKAFNNKDDISNCTYNIIITDKEKEDIIIKIIDGKINGYTGTDNNADVIINVESHIFDRILSGKLTAQRAFLTGQLKAKGNFTLLYEFDHLFKL